MKQCFYVLQLCFIAINVASCGGSAQDSNSNKIDVNVTTASTEQWQSLISNNDLSQWKIKGGQSTYAVENNIITGTSVASKNNTFLISNNIYTDFIFETDVKVNAGMNSGIQFRSNTHEKGYVYGYQMEIDTSQRAWSGGIYDQSRRGWIYNLTRNEACQSEFIVDDWNQYRIEAIGNTLKTFINGVPCASVVDEQSLSGFLALQVHSAGKAKNGKKVQWRNPRIITVNPSKYVLKVAEENEILVFNYLENQISESEKAQGWTLIPITENIQELSNEKKLVIDNPHPSFELELDVKITDHLNASINYLLANNNKGLTLPLIDNKLANLSPNTLDSFGAIKNIVEPHNLSEPDFKSMRQNNKGQWNRIRVVVQETSKDNFHVEHWINNIQIAQHDLSQTSPLSKIITISLQQGELIARNLKLKPLPTYKAESNPGDREGHIMKKVVPEDVIPPSPILAIEEALQAFKVHKDFNIEVIAQDPLIFDPIVAIYDAAGRIWAIEMTTFMQDTLATGEMAPESQIVVLTDTNNDGKMDKRQVIIDKITLPRALAFVPNGIIWADSLKLYFSELTEKNGEFTLVHTEVVDPTYAKGGNLEHKTNGLLYSLDNWYYNAKSNVRYRPIPLAQEIPKGAKEVYRNKHWKMLKAHTEYRGQWGITQDDYGRHYFNGNSSPILTSSYLPNVVNRLPQHKFSSEFVNQKIGDNLIFPVRVTPGINRGYNKGMYDENFRLKMHTAACGPLIYRGNQFPKEYYGIGLAQEPAGNLVKATKISEENGIVTGENLFHQQEILASTDERFRPVNAVNAPDGTITIVDFYHGILQHRVFLTTYLSEQIKSRDLERNKHVGRLYRLKHKNSKVKDIEYLNNLNALQLVPFLAHDNGWHRDTAQQLIVMKQDKSIPVISALKEMAIEHQNHLAQIKALWALEGLNAIDLALLKKAGTSQKSDNATYSKVKRSVYRLSEQLESTSQLKQWIETEVKTANTETSKSLVLAAGSHNVFSAVSNLINNFGVNDFVIASIGIQGDLYLAQQSKYLKKIDQNQLQLAFDKAKIKPKTNKLSGEFLASFNRGKDLFRGEVGCFGCHGLDGEGNEMVPPLNQSKWVTESPKQLAAILLHGLSGPISVKGKTYSGTMTMPGLGSNSHISDKNLADIANYIRNAWQNKSPQVSEQLIKKIRQNTQNQQSTYTVETLKNAKF